MVRNRVCSSLLLQIACAGEQQLVGNAQFDFWLATKWHWGTQALYIAHRVSRDERLLSLAVRSHSLLPLFVPRSISHQVISEPKKRRTRAGAEEGSDDRQHPG